MAKFLVRSRYEVSNDGEVLAAVTKFIADNISSFQAALTDSRLIANLQNLNGLTINELFGLKYMFALKGIDLWIYYVSENAINEVDVDPGMFEYNVLDYTAITGSFVPMCTKFVQSSSENSIVKLYSDIADAYGLFEGRLFTSMNNPLKKMIEEMRHDETALGVVATMKTTYVNSILDYLKKEIKVITD
jgi:hypothetical protein